MKFLRDEMERKGCPTPREFFRVEECGESTTGGFRPGEGVTLCRNNLYGGRDVDDLLAHELVHAYDHCRAKDLDWAKCEHHACSEVRAAALSGDCDFGNEFARGHWRVKGQLRRCARRRAELSVALNPYCASPGRAEAAVDRVFERCLRDTAPFPPSSG